MPSTNIPIDDIPLLKGLSDDDLKELGAVSSLKLVEAGQPLLKCGETPAYLMFILNGRLQAHETSEDGRVIGVGLFNPGDAVGWLPLIDGKPMTCTIEALEPTQIFLIPMAVAQRMVLTRPIITERLLKLLAVSIRQATTEKSMLSLPNAFHRVFVQIQQLSQDAAAGQPLTHLPKQQELASIVNTSRETVSRALQLLIKNGVIGKMGHQVVIREGDLLKRLASDGPEALPKNKQ